MKQIIRLTESELHKIIESSVRRVIQEGAFDKYQKDLMDIALDSNMNTNADTGFAHAYAMGDPMVKNVKGSAMRDMLSDTMGNDISQDGDTMDNVNW